MELTGSVLITGGAGFLGRAIIQTAHDYGWDCKITVYSRDEEKQWKLRHKFPEVSCILGDVRDSNRLRAAIAGRDTVIHAAAVKFVPEAEQNVLETVMVNVDGTYNVATVCAEAGVGTAIFVSTDKACQPVNLYGATKMVGEKIWTECAQHHDTRFAVARYGNVIGSTGSLVPLFKRQLETTGRISVTDPEMTRFFMPPEDAVSCILHAIDAAANHRGLIVGALCKAMAIGDVAHMIATSDLIDIIGPRPGEKKHETLLHEYEAARSFFLPDSHFGVLPSWLRAGFPVDVYTSESAPRISSAEFSAAMDYAAALG